MQTDLTLPEVVATLRVSRASAVRLARMLARETPPRAWLVRRGIRGTQWLVAAEAIDRYAKTAPFSRT